jgi:hypothetical protein
MWRGQAVQVQIEKRLNARVGGAEVAAEAQVFLVVIAEQRAGQFEEIRIGIGAAGGLPERGQLEIDVAG